MSVAHDRKFLDRFSLMIGILLGVVAGIYVLANYVVNRGETERGQDAEYRRLVAERIAPPGKVAIAGQDNSALAIVPTTDAERADTAVAMPTTGAEVIQQACVACHGQGIGGAPRIGDAAAWSARIAKGKSTLYQHAIEGFQGQTGLMPPKGGRTDISDELIQAAVDHMIETSH